MSAMPLRRSVGTIRLEGHEHVPRLPTIASRPATAIDHNDFPHFWNIAVKEFCEATGQDRQDLLRPLTKEEIWQDIERTSARDKANIESKALSNVVSGLLSIADLVVDAVSDVSPGLVVSVIADLLILLNRYSPRSAFASKPSRFLSSFVQLSRDHFPPMPWPSC